MTRAATRRPARLPEIVPELRHGTVTVAVKELPGPASSPIGGGRAGSVPGNRAEGKGRHGG